MNTTRRSTLAAVATLGALAALPGRAAAEDHWSSWFGNGAKIEGSGKVVDDTRALTGFNAIHFDGPFDLELVNAASEDVVVHGDDNLLEMVETHVDGQTLVISARRGSAYRSRRGLSVTIHFKEISSLILSGSGDVVADRITTRRFDTSISGSSDVKIGTLTADIVAVSISGSGDFSASGTAQTQGFNVSGSGDIDARRLKGETVAIRIAGSGDALVNASGNLDVAIAGSGDVVYSGSPTIRKSIAGSGSVTPAK